MPAAMTSATPRLVRETSAARAAGVTGAAGRAGRSPARRRAGVGRRRRRRGPLGRAGDGAAGQAAAEPLAPQQRGARGDEHERPDDHVGEQEAEARGTSAGRLSARNAIPTATSIVPRLVRSHTGVAGASPAGRNTQASR